MTSLNRRFRLAALVLLIAPIVAFAQFGDPTTDDVQILSVRPLVSHESIAPGQTVSLAARLDLADEWHINSASPLQDYLIPTRLDLVLADGLTAGTIDYPSGDRIPLLGEEMSVYGNGDVIRVPIAVSPEAAHGQRTINGVLHYQACNNVSCVAAAEAELTWSFVVGPETSALLHPEVFSATQITQHSTAVTAAAVPKTDNELERLVAEHGNWGYVLALLVAFGTGFLLSFSPCTYPMIPITVSIFAGQARGAGRGFALSILYVLTMALIYGVMGAIVATVGGVFGAWLAHPVVVGVIVAVFIIFALSMFGLYELQVPAALRNKMAGKGGSGMGGAIVLGAIAALVISPCVGPFVAGIMLYIATTGSTILGFLILFTFALGLGTLFVLIGTFSSAIQALPNAGVWMESVKKFFGFILLLMALYFARTLLSTGITALLAALLFLAAGVFGGGFDRLTSEATFFPRLKKAFGILCTILGVYLLAGYLVANGFIWPPVNFEAASLSGGDQREKIQWRTEMDSGLAEARGSGRPTLIDTWATWCANCYKLDENTWSDDQVAAEARRFVPLKLQLEKSDAPETRKFLEVFGLRQYSLPTVLLLDSSGQVRDVIQGYVGPEEMLRRMQAVT